MLGRFGRAAGKAVGRSSGATGRSTRSLDSTAKAMFDDMPEMPLSRLLNAPSSESLGITGRSTATRGLRPRSTGGVPRGGYRL